MSVEETANIFSNEIAPGSQPRDTDGKFVSVRDRPEPMFNEREVEGDPFTGDTSDGGDNQGLRAREREIADGRVDERQGRSTSDAQDLRRTESDDEGIPFDPEEQTGEATVVGSVPAEGEDDEKYEVVVNGAKQEVTLRDALTSYATQQQLAERNASLDQMQQVLNDDYLRQQNNWNLLIKARQDYEEDLANLVPTEPDWDAEFARDPAGAHVTQKIFQTIYGKLNHSREYRARMEAMKAEEQNRHTHRYAVNGFSKFVMDNKIPDEPTLKKEISSMRRTAADAGFSEYEIGTTYDPRMLTVLRWASKYRRMMTAQMRLRAVVPGKGKTLAPGAAAPIGAPRRGGLDDAQRRLASSGKLSDAVDVFRKLL